MLSPVGAISGLTADISQMDPVASVQDGVFGERDICYFQTVRKTSRGGKGFPCLLFLNIFSSLVHTSPFPQLHCRRSQ